jgi:hypothetical protein
MTWNDRGTYQIAHDDLAVLVGRGSLGGGRPCASATSGLGGLLDATDGSIRVLTSSGTTGGVTTASGVVLGRGNIVKSLVELAGHIGGV